MADAGAIYRINDWALAQWTSGANAAAASTYLRRRGIAVDQLPPSYQVGYARPGWTRLASALSAEQRADAEGAGLVVRLKDGRLIDRFRDRVMLPIRTSNGHIAGFIGRAVHDLPDAPKYLNTATTDVFRKSELLYGLHEGLRAGGVQPVLVEGPLDALALAACADHDMLPLATSGTAFTCAHAETITSLCRDHHVRPVVAFDGDQPGRAAAIRAGELLRSVGADPHLAQLADGQDPADHVAAHGSLDTFRPCPLGRAVPLIAATTEEIISRVHRGSDPQWPETKLAIVRVIGAELRSYPPEQRVRAAGIAATVAVAKAGIATESLLELAASLTGTSSCRAVDTVPPWTVGCGPAV